MSNFVIDSEVRLREKLDLISNLLDIKVAVEAGAKKSTRQASSAKKAAVTLEPNPTDTNYAALKCEIEALDPNHSEY